MEPHGRWRSLPPRGRPRAARRSRIRRSLELLLRRSSGSAGSGRVRHFGAMNAPSSMHHALAACGMVVVTLMWSTAGVVSRSLQTAESFEVTFFRSLFNLAGLGLALTWMRGWSLWADLLRSPRVVWMSGGGWR